MKNLLLGVTLVATAACAKQPENIAAVDVGTAQYASYSCAQLAEARLKYAQTLENLSARQKSAASGDAWGVFLLGLPLSSMSGGDQETNIAVTKGHIQSVDEARLKKGCKDA
ncbi:MAG: hypothetical protein RLN85_20885 [Pseudomonadales bacterium]